MDIAKTITALEKNRFKVCLFKTAAEAADYLDRSIDGLTVGFGDSVTLKSMQLYELLKAHNTVYDPNHSKDNDEFVELANKCFGTDIYITSVNAISETGEMVNIDGTGNRVAASLFSHRRVYFVAGTNKIEETLDKAIWRARNIAAPRNACRLKLRTPCAMTGGVRCYNCSSPERICNALDIYMKKMNDVEEVEVVLIDEELGY